MDVYIMKIIFTNAQSNNYSFIDHDDDEIMNKMPFNRSLHLFGNLSYFATCP